MKAVAGVGYRASCEYCLRQATKAKKSAEPLTAQKTPQKVTASHPEPLQSHREPLLEKMTHCPWIVMSRGLDNVDGSRVMELLQERWVPVFGRMRALRKDPEGAWRNKEVHARLSDMQIGLDLHPGEASWHAHDDENRTGET